jgi:hypothetical protein
MAQATLPETPLFSGSNARAAIDGDYDTVGRSRCPRASV